MAPLNILVPLDSTGPLHLVVLRDLKLSLVQVVKTDWAVGVHIKLMDICTRTIVLTESLQW